MSSLPVASSPSTSATIVLHLKIMCVRCPNGWNQCTPRLSIPRFTIFSIAATLHGVTCASCSALRYSRRRSGDTGSFTPLHRMLFCQQPNQSRRRLANPQLAAFPARERVAVHPNHSGKLDLRKSERSADFSHLVPFHAPNYTLRLWPQQSYRSSGPRPPDDHCLHTLGVPCLFDSGFRLGPRDPRQVSHRGGHQHQIVTIYAVGSLEQADATIRPQPHQQPEHH